MLSHILENVKGGKMKETLEILENKLFMLEMQDHWESSDYRYAEELRERIRKVKQDGKN